MQSFGTTPAGGDLGFEYLDHTADVIIHAWGVSLSAAFENAGKALFHYMTDTDRVEPRERRTVQASGGDLEDLLFHFMDELLFLYGSEYFVACNIDVTRLDAANGCLSCEVRGEVFDRSKHSQGTEVKAITMHEMKVWQKREAAADGEANGEEREGSDSTDNNEEKTREDGRAVEVFVLVDI